MFRPKLRKNKRDSRWSLSIDQKPTLPFFFIVLGEKILGNNRCHPALPPGLGRGLKMWNKKERNEERYLHLVEANLGVILSVLSHSELLSLDNQSGQSSNGPSADCLKKMFVITQHI